ncbi:pyridoxamine 5'-phosphate oxidase family protein [Spirochaeta isovalerica]|uniref:Pyridoxamine 5'-phosphate oxidase N-terminal domain-containing protein n=1 Tax=Spirochaeta isovalerica TaxID=150 RepID=A0A841REK5_9SPIO|nr:pyridoxamine 5'-phosphate oxidase family protein [Spirochaeta isovalerica]MBB6482423.1 hypothetical protein [Spirochaeta isovalerica]
MTDSKFEKDDLVDFKKDEKVGLVSTVDRDGNPHVSLITSIQATDEKHLILGQFCEGRSKDNLRERPRSGFLILTLDMSYWMGTMSWTGEADTGEELEEFNMKPMWRYNTYFGIHRAHYLDVRTVHPRKKISIPALLPSIITGRMTGLFTAGTRKEKPINRWTEKLLNNLSSLSFLSWVDKEGYPVIFPALQLFCRHGNQVLFAPGEYGKEFETIEKGSVVVVYSLSLQMESVLLRGSFSGLRRVAGMKVGIIEIDWVYNSMPPVPGQIYPEIPLEAVVVNKD